MARWVSTATSIKRKQRRRRILVFSIQALFCTVVYSLTAYGFASYIRASDEFRVARIQIGGVNMVQDADVISLGGVTAADNIFQLDIETIADRVDQMPFVEGCRVTRIFPDKIAYVIDERVALATIVVSNHLFEVDRAGNVLRELQPDQEHTGPLITEIADITSVEVGTRLTSPALHRALDVWCAFVQTEMAKQVTVSEICVAQQNRVCMYCDELQCEIRWGRDDYEKQAMKLDIFWQNLAGHIPYNEYVDLRFANDVACR